VISPNSPIDPAAGTAPNTPRPAHKPVRAALQLLGFLGGIALLIWCIAVALRPENRDQLARLRDAKAWEVAALLGLTAVSLIVNGLSFWSSVRPIRSIAAPAILATNALATFLNYLPFKIGALARIAIHNRRDRLPLLTIGAWFVAMTVLITAVLAPLIAASLWRRTIDNAWWAASITGLILCYLSVVGLARTFAGLPGLARLHFITTRVGWLWLQRLVGTLAFSQLHRGLSILADAKATALTMLFRITDIAVQSLRFVLVAQMIHEPLTFANAFLAASTYFIIGVLSPAGMLGAREGGTAALVSVPASATLLVGAGEIIVNLIGALIAVTYLRLDKLLRSKPTSSSSSERPVDLSSMS